MTLTNVYWIPGPWKGRLGIVPRPRGGDWLEDETRAWREAGIDVVVSLLEPHEQAHFMLQDEAAYATTNGIQCELLPIPDRGLPASRQSVADLTARLLPLLAEGKSVVVHCRQSIGRASMIAAAVLIVAGIPASEAVERVARARGLDVPETDEQRTWIDDFARSRAS